jgi:hypothetical protein
MTELEFKSKHPGFALKYGKSSENGRWWADARTVDNHCVALSGKTTLSDVLIALDEAINKKPRLSGPTPRQPVSYGLIEDVERLEQDPEEPEG